MFGNLTKGIIKELAKLGFEIVKLVGAVYILILVIKGLFNTIFKF